MDLGSDVVAVGFNPL